MCLGIPGQIVNFSSRATGLAIVDIMGVNRAINIGLLAQENLVPGDWVLVHVGFAVTKMAEEEARASLDFLREISEAHIAEPVGANTAMGDAINGPGKTIPRKPSES